jgi:hypothetical protein
MFIVNHDDPLSTAAAALSIADALLPDLEAAVPDLPGGAAAADFARLSGRLTGAWLFEGRTLPPLRRLLAAVEASVAKETGDAVGAGRPYRRHGGVQAGDRDPRDPSK